MGMWSFALKKGGKAVKGLGDDKSQAASQLSGSDDSSAPKKKIKKPALKPE